MKKNFTKALSLLLVLVMILGAMPMAMATEPETPTVPDSVTVSISPSNPKVGDEVTVSVAIPAGYEASNITWTGFSSTAETFKTVVQAAGDFTATVNLKLTSATDETVYGVAAGSKTITVAAVATGLEIQGASTTTAAENLQLKAVATPEGAALPGAVTWTSSDTTVATVNGGLVVPRKVGEVTIFAACGDLTDSHAVTITNVVVVPNVTPTSLTLDPGKTGSIGGTYSPATAAQYITTTMTSKNTSIATVNASTGVVTAVAAGTTAITVKGTIKSDAPSYVRFADGKTTFEVDVPVTVTNKAYIGNVKNQSAMVGSSITLSPVLYDGSNKAMSATFTAVATGCTLTQSGQSWIASSNTSGVATVTFTAAYIDGTETKTISKTITLGFYRSTSLKVTLLDHISSFRFNDKNIFKAASSGTQNYTNLTSLTMVDLLGYAMYTPTSTATNYYSFGISGTNGGELLSPTSGSTTSWGSGSRFVDASNVDSVGFQQKSSSNKTSTFTISAISGNTTDGVIVGTVTVEINAGAASGGIEYSTTYNTPITFKAADFQTYWNTHKNTTTGSYTTSSLSYVQFGITNQVPAYGKLYTTSAKTTAATSGMSFSPTTTTSSSYYSLGSLTYVPDTYYTSAYSVDIPFTATGTDGTSLSGYVTIKLNEKGSTIGARGTTLGTTEAASIAANYLAAKGQNLSYVVFTLPSAQEATLYRSIPKVNGYSRVTEAVRVVAGDKFYYNVTTGTTTTTITGGTDCGCHNQQICYNSYCVYYDGGYAYNNPSCGCNNLTLCYNQYCIYYDGVTTSTTSTGTMMLADVSIVPAAGFKGKLTIPYTAYAAGGATNSAYTGYLVYDVETKTVSAVFSDVKSNYSWAADSADFLYYEGTAQGSNGKYNPSANITRGDFMLMLYRAFLADDYGTYSVTTNFSDVVKGNTTYSQETYQAVGVAKYLGIAQGSNEKFNPKANITREEAMVLIYRTLEKCNRTLRYTSSTSASSFTDYSSISSWATTAISSLVSKGVIQGSNNKITPKSNITRAEMACILHRVITY